MCASSAGEDVEHLLVTWGFERDRWIMMDYMASGWGNMEACARRGRWHCCGKRWKSQCDGGGGQTCNILDREVVAEKEGFVVYIWGANG